MESFIVMVLILGLLVCDMCSGFLNAYAFTAVSPTQCSLSTRWSSPGLVLFRSFLMQKFYVNEVVESESCVSVVELKENGEVVCVGTTSPNMQMRGNWALGSENELRMTLERTFHGKFTENTKFSHLVSCELAATQSHLELTGELRDESNTAMPLGGFVMTPFYAVERNMLSMVPPMWAAVAKSDLGTEARAGRF
jgi:hypothetical protein